MIDHLISDRHPRHLPRASCRHTASWCALAHAACLSLLVCLVPAQAQLQRKQAPALAPSRLPGAQNMSPDLSIAGKQTTADYIVAVVNSEVITHTDIDKRVNRIIDTAQRGTKLPPTEELRHQVLEAMIDEKAQLSYAKMVGLDVSDAEVEGTIEGIASQNQVSMAELKRRMEADGLDFARYRASLREQILLQRLREKEVTARIKISDEDLDNFIKNDPAAQAELKLNVAHILIPVPDEATPAELEALHAKAQDIQSRAAKGANFAQLAKDYSADSNTKDQGGAFGLRPASRIPDLFVSIVQPLKVGQVAPVAQSNAGFHIVKLLERENTAEATYTEQRARHILLRTPPQQAVADQLKRLSDIRKQIVDNQASFAQMARQYSEDGSASRGGDLGWAVPGQFVPEFEKVLTALQPGEISEPVVSRFGVHLIQLIERREVKLTEAQKREAARNVLRERKFEPTYEEWARELRAAAYLEMRDAP